MEIAAAGGGERAIGAAVKRCVLNNLGKLHASVIGLRLGPAIQKIILCQVLEGRRSSIR
jgi:hypothetical protein